MHKNYNIKKVISWSTIHYKVLLLCFYQNMNTANVMKERCYIAIENKIVFLKQSQKVKEARIKIHTKDIEKYVNKKSY